MKKAILILSVTALAVSSCKKEDAKSCDKTMAAIAGTYSLVKVEQGGGGSFSDVTDTYVETCQKDDKLTLNADGTGAYTDQGTKCDPDGTASASWSIDSNGKLSIDHPSFVLEDVDIISFDCSTLVAEENFGTVGGIDIKARFTFKK